MQTLPIHIFTDKKPHPLIYCRKISDTFMHWIRIQNKQTIGTFARYPIISYQKLALQFMLAMPHMDVLRIQHIDIS
jgi:hypothetical protein